MTLSVPGKTFLVGEYVALEGGPSLLLATGPRFEMRVDAGGRISGSRPHPFAPASPAGRFYQKHADRFAGLGIQFRDPHQGRGGLGASSAQFALLYSYLNPKIDWTAMLAEYRACAWNGEGTPPSGADVIAQVSGGVCRFDGVRVDVQKLSWSFADLGFTLVRTGAKLATHEHLRGRMAPPNAALRECVRRASEAFASGDPRPLIEAVAETARRLSDAGLAAPMTRLLLDELSEQPWALSAKGCGAMGADVILILHARGDGARVRAWADGRGLKLCGRTDELSEGLRREVEEVEA